MPGLAHDEPLLTQATELVSTTQKTFRPQEIPVQHQQLRHYLKATDSGLIYYATRNQAYALRGRKRKLIARVDFKIQCLTAGFGWLCVGGPEKGQCAFLRLQMEDDDAHANQDYSAANTLLPLNLQSLIRSDSPEGVRRVRSNSSSGFPQSARSIHYKKIGEEIVNAITLQTIPSANSGAREDTVAVVATNDCTVTVYSLERMEVLHTLYFQQAMNHASLSPDGSLLVACGDIDRVFFFSRKRARFGAFGQRWTTEWEDLATPRITSFAVNDHCFTTAFSPDGQYCTIASQAGMLVKLEVKSIHADMKDDNATVEKLTSSRPAPLTRQITYLWRGAIRSTAFSSNVWGLLAWSETRGRVCVSDMRNRNRPPQVIHLARKDPRNVVVELSDASQNDLLNDEEPFSQTLTRLGPVGPASTVRDQLNEVSTAVDYLEEAAQHRQLQQLLQSLDRGTRNQLEDQPRLQDLMDEIREMSEDLDNLETTTIAAREAPGAPRRRPSVVFTLGDERSSSATTSSLAPVLPYISGLTTSPSQLARDRSLETSTSPPLTQSGSGSTNVDPWQTISAALAGASNSRSRRASLEANLRNLRETRDSIQRAQRASRTREDQLAPRMNWERSTAARLRASRTAVASNATTGQSAASTTQSRRAVHDGDDIGRSALSLSLDGSTSRLSQVERDLAQLEDRQARLYSQTTQSPEASTTYARARGTVLPTLRSAERASYQRLLQGEATDGGGDDDEPEIMGLDWSHDGRTLFVATDVGIFELKVNIAARKTFAAPTRLQ